MHLHLVVVTCRENNQFNIATSKVTHHYSMWLWKDAIITYRQKACPRESSGTSCCFSSSAFSWSCNQCCCSGSSCSWDKCPSWSDQGRYIERRSSRGPCSWGSPQRDALPAHAHTSWLPQSLCGDKTDVVKWWLATMRRELEMAKRATKLKYLLPAAAVDSTSPKEQPGCTSPPLGYISMCPIGSWIPILTPKAPRVYVCRTSTNSASSGESRLWASVPSNMGPAGSKPVQKGQRFRYLGLNVCKKTNQFQSFVLKRKKKKTSPVIRPIFPFTNVPAYPATWAPRLYPITCTSSSCSFFSSYQI